MVMCGSHVGYEHTFNQIYYHRGRFCEKKNRSDGWSLFIDYNDFSLYSGMNIFVENAVNKMEYLKLNKNYLHNSQKTIKYNYVSSF